MRLAKVSALIIGYVPIDFVFFYVVGEKCLFPGLGPGYDDLGSPRLSVLNRSRVLAAKIANELRNKRLEHFDEFSLADIYYSLEHVADVLSTVNGSQAQHPQRHG
jgi:hypothetical protein